MMVELSDGEMKVLAMFRSMEAEFAVRQIEKDAEAYKVTGGRGL